MVLHALLKGDNMCVSCLTARKLVHDAAVHMSVTDEDAFQIICASSESGVHDPDEWRENLEHGFDAPTWFVDTAIDIITERIALVDFPVAMKARKKKPKPQ